MAQLLIVEDDLILLEAYQVALKAAGHDVEVASDGVQALELAKTKQFDLILLDMLMPNMDGIEFLKTFDIKQKHPQTKVIVFSNMSVPESVNQAVELGATKYLNKSTFTPKEMVEMIDQVVGTTKANK